MSYAELISRLSALPMERCIELFDFTGIVSVCFSPAMDVLHSAAEWDDAGFDRTSRHEEAVFCIRDDTQGRLH